MMKSDKQKTPVQQTSSQFYKSNVNEHEESFSYEVEIEREYVQRLKVQRQKIELLYSKYDVLLKEMKKKDVELKEKDDNLSTINMKVKDLQLNCQQLAMLQEEHQEALNENMQLKHRVVKLENENAEMIEQMKLKDCLVYDEKNQLDMVNEQLQDKLRSLTNQLLLSKEEMRNFQEAEKQRAESVKSKHFSQISALNSELNMLKNEIIKRDESIHMLRLQNEFMQQKLQDQEDNYTVYLKELQSKIQKNQKEKKLQIQALRNSLQGKSLEITTLESKVLSFKSQLEAKQLELEDAKKVLRDEKKLFDDDIFQLKTQMNNEKLYFREQIMYCQNHIEKLEKKLNQSLKRQKDLGERIKRQEMNDAAKRNLRQIQRQQLQKINRILAFQ